MPTPPSIPAAPVSAAPVVPSSGALQPLGLTEVHITGGFWARRQEVNASGSLAHIAARLESAGWLPNFDLAACGLLPEGRRGREFSDSEVYKYLEALSWEGARSGDGAVEAALRGTVARVAAAQEADGYLNTNFGRPGQRPRWSDLEWGHELYCFGHLFQAAVARHRTAPGADDGLVDVAVRAADLVCATFADDGNRGVCGHPEIEAGLAELGRALGRSAYIEQAARFVERRGHHSLADIDWGAEYFQDDVPVRDATVLRGHAVRANYLAAGAADIAAEHADAGLAAALRTQWERTVSRRTYITGGQGSHHQDEAFGADWELPADRAYSETCAGVGSIMFSWRMLLADGDPRYADLIERTLYNVVATSPADDGCSFFYANTLHQRIPGVVPDPDATSPRASSSLRAPWFEVSCCPPNVARTLASLDAYVATRSGDGIQVHQYAPARLRTRLASGDEVTLTIDTAYPADGLVRITVQSDATFALRLRVPAWAAGATVEVIPVGGIGETLPAAPGSVEVRRHFVPGDVVVLALPMAPRLTRPDPRIDASRGCVAVERGPEVLALESTDLAAFGITDVEDAVIATTPPTEHHGHVWAAVSHRVDRVAEWPYGEASPHSAAAPTEVPLIPYHSWGNRGPSTMRVWIPTA